MAQLGDYNELFYLTKFIFGLHLAILTEVSVHRLATLLEAKRIAEELELTQTMVKMHQKFEKEKTTKIAQHRGTQERRSNRLHQSIHDRAQMKTCRDRKQRQKTDFFVVGYIFTLRGARGVSCPEVHGPAIVLRSMLENLPPRDRVGHMRTQGSVVTADLEALMRMKERRLFANTNAAGMSMHPPSGGLKSP